MEAWVKKNPCAIAAISGADTLTYDALNQRANQLAHYLKALGVKPEQRIALCLPPSMDVLVAMLGVLKAGAAYVPLDPSLPANRLSYILNDCDAVALLTQSSIRLPFLSHPWPMILLDKVPDISRYPTKNLELNLSSENLAYVIYTSGTTGRPKGVLLEHRSVVNYGDWFASFTHARPQMRVDWSSNYMFDMAVSTTIIPLTLGLTVVVCAENVSRNFRAYLHYLQSSQIQLCKMTPTYFKELLREVKNTPIDLPDLERIVLGGEPLRASDCQQWLQVYPHHRLINEYGPTEATVAFSHFTIDKDTSLSSRQDVLIGKPGFGMYFYILDAFGQPVAEGDEGELYIGGAGLARGYLNLAELTQACFIPDPFLQDARLYKTGDVCRLLPDGSIEYLDRIDRQVKIRGFRVELNEIEQCLHAHPAIAAVAILVRENEQEDLWLIAYYIAETSVRAITHQEMREYMLQSLPNYMIPNAFVQMDAFPMAANGKLDYALLPQHKVVQCDINEARSSLERSLVEIWSRELGLPSVRLDDDFWALGGHSLIALRIVAEVNQLLEKNITAADVYQAMTVRKLAKMIKKMKTEATRLDELDSKGARQWFALSAFQTVLWASKTFKPKAAQLNIMVRKRFQGTLDIQRLQSACDQLIAKHQILSYRILKFLPIQGGVGSKPVFIESMDMQDWSEEDTDDFLQKSMDNTLHFSRWNKRLALLKATVFYLRNGETELHIGMPHIISDGISMDILLAELSFLYLNKPDQLDESAPFASYVLDEQLQMEQKNASEKAFWSEYLHDAHLFSFPARFIKDPASLDGSFSYSTYVPISSQAMHHLEVFCRNQQVHFSDALCAAIGMALKQCGENPAVFERPLVMNVVKSSRDHLKYLNTIGCFLRIEPVKLWLDAQQTVLSLSRQVHDFFVLQKSVLQGSSILKLAALGPYYRKRKGPVYFGMKGFIFLYMRLMRMLNINHDVLQYFPDLSLLDTNNRFMIYLNIWNNFVTADASEEALFGLNSKPIKMVPYDLLAVDYIFEACFLRDTQSNKPYVVLSSNLDPAFRERIAREIVRIMNEDMVVASREVALA